MSDPLFYAEQLPGIGGLLKAWETKNNVAIRHKLWLAANPAMLYASYVAPATQQDLFQGQGSAAFLRYGDVVACSGVDLSLRGGEIHGVLGENGAGKSTLMKVLIGLVQPDEGEIHLYGRHATIGDPQVAAKLGIGMVHQHFSEQQIYRIDHYLGKETVQNLLVFRLANNLIESAWNRDRIESVQITVGETLGVGSRAGYYDKSGAMRDMVQNHIAQVLTLAAMDVPQSFDAEAIRAEKIKILRSIEPIDLKKGVVRGQRPGVIP